MKIINILVDSEFAEKMVFPTDEPNSEEANSIALMAFNVFASGPSSHVIKNTGPAPVIGSDFDINSSNQFSFEDEFGTKYYVVLVLDEKVAFVMNYEYSDNSAPALALFSSFPTFEEAV